MGLGLVKKEKPFNQQTLDELGFRLDGIDSRGNYDLKLELLSRIKDEASFSYVMYRLNNTLLDSATEKGIINNAVKDGYKGKYTSDYIRGLKDSFEQYRELTFEDGDDVINKNVADIISMAEANSGNHLDKSIGEIDAFMEMKISNDN